MQANTASPLMQELPAPLPLLPGQDPWRRTIRPIGTYVLNGITVWGDRLVLLDSVRGFLLGVDPTTDSATVLNPLHVEQFVDAVGLAVWQDTLWFARDDSVYYCRLDDLTPQHFVSLDYSVTGVGVWESTVYVASQRLGYITVFERETAREITRFPMPGVGEANLTLRQEELWVCDRIEQTVYCLDRATGEQQFCVLTPFDSPTGLTFYPHPQTKQDILYVCYASEEPYIRDNPNAEDPLELSIRDRTFVHPLYIHYNPQQRYALSNGYLIEMYYVEELLPTEEGQVHLDHLEWRIALPATTDRQKVHKVEPIGRPFVEEIQQGQRVAVFKFDSIKPHERHLFGWKATLAVHSIKYKLTLEDVDRIPPLSAEYQAKYLVDDDELAMDTPTIQEAARAAIGTETNILRKMLKIRNYVYDRLSYGLTARIDTPDVVLERGVGSCGEYVGLLLALARLNGIACRTVGRYKCPPQADLHNVPLQPDYNHVWIEFYIPGFGWLPMESNPDDIAERGPYPTRFFMGLPWHHAEIAKGIPFETISIPTGDMEVAIGDLAINHIRFTILGELPPPSQP